MWISFFGAVATREFGFNPASLRSSAVRISCWRAFDEIARFRMYAGILSSSSLIGFILFTWVIIAGIAGANKSLYNLGHG